MTGDRVTANLPARDFSATAAFWQSLGFTEAYRDAHWMILCRGPLQVEFFPHPDLDPATSWFSACIRVDDIDALYAEWSALDWPAGGAARFVGWQDWGPDVPRAFALSDTNGSLLRVLANPG